MNNKIMLELLFIWLTIGLISMIVWRVALLIKEPGIWRGFDEGEIPYFVVGMLSGPITTIVCILSFKKIFKQ